VKTRAAVLVRMGEPRPYAKSRPLRIEEVLLEGPHAGEALVEVLAAGVCHSDLSVVDGTRPRVLPLVLGHEAAGVVREVGPGVVGVRPGDHVVFSYVPTCGRCSFCASGRPALCDPGSRANAAGVLLDGTTHFRDGEGRVLHHHLGVSAFSRYTVRPRSLWSLSTPPCLPSGPRSSGVRSSPVWGRSSTRPGSRRARAWPSSGSGAWA